MDSVAKRVEGIFYAVFPSLEGTRPDFPTLSKSDVVGWNSVEHLSLLVALEEEFQISIPDEVAITLFSFPAICDYLGSAQGTP